jgi:Uma2 family endonuclease
MQLNLSRHSAPQPDIAVVAGTVGSYATPPATALLVVEVSDATLWYDRNRKAAMYARAGIADYWIVNIRDRQLEIRRTPIPDPGTRQGHRYDHLSVLTPPDHATPLAAPQAQIAVADLLP